MTTNRPLRVYLLALSSAAWLPCVAHADEDATAASNGFTFLSDTPNVTHWGLGAGVGVRASPYAGDGADVTPLPLVYFENKWARLFGTTLDLKIGQWEGVSVALRGQVGLFGGYKQSDAPILNGMEDRDGIAFWYGPALAWQSPFGTLSGSYLVGGNKGQRATIDFSKSFKSGNWSLTPRLGAEWLSNEYVDYYYGVTAPEARTWRPAYSGSSTWKASGGVRVDYSLTPRQQVTFDVGVSYLGRGISDSPLTGRRWLPEARLGYMYRFK
ncbi:MipA/OmpV family protein [Trinickia caryophylli]|uniref:Outer membrane protein n=1 Tax=Trinickia caryophylli TaxID=28094 RepID=A0A1X7H5K7_TRICW|nr:MipA/OmpV family protein [Trinickia caryophylli]WQE11929.1 MipA/OmpV family protein [Trinickia caryophylli]GLU35682.1 outer membrane protein [Trinickia caryophylli]SMF79277.1 outer membrane protein [Trinickia caryophylli]